MLFAGDQDRLTAGLRYFGTLLQVAGLSTVTFGLHRTRKLFNRPPLLQKLREVLGRLRSMFRPAEPITLRAEGGSYSTAFGNAKLTVKLPPGASLERRVEFLERSFEQLESALDTRVTEFSGKIDELQKGISRQERDWREAYKRTEKLIQDITIGGLDLEIVGLVWLAVGIVCAGVPGEVALLLYLLLSPVW